MTDKEILIQNSIGCILECIGEDLGREGLLDTPSRVSRMYEEIFHGYCDDPAEILSAQFQKEGEDMIIVRDISFYSHCEHHMVPFHGKVHIGYIPGNTIVGLSKLVRLVECFSHRLQIQERLTSQIADAILEELNCCGVGVIIEAEHLCMKMRGVKNPCADTVTSTMRGVFRDQPVREEFLNLVRD